MSIKLRRMRKRLMVLTLTLTLTMSNILVYAQSSKVQLKQVTITNPKEELPEGVIPFDYDIVGYKGSTAQKYAEDYGNKFIDIEELPEVTPTLPETQDMPKVEPIVKEPNVEKPIVEEDTINPPVMKPIGTMMSPMSSVVTDPEVTVTGDITTKTSKDLTMNITVSDAESGIDHVRITLPTGETITPTLPTYGITSNGTYVVTATDKAGNVTTATINIDNIDKVPQVLTINPYNTEWTNQDITVTATTDKGTLNKASHKFTENGSTTFTSNYIDADPVSKTVTINNIDKVVPTKPTFNRTGENLTVTLGTDALSGIKEHKFSTNGTSWDTYTTPINLKTYDDGTHTFRVKAVDNAGNESAEDTITVTLTYLADATAVVVIAENSLLESDYDLAVDAVNYLESSAGKTALEGRLVTLLNKINFIKGLDSSIDSLTTIDTNWNNINLIRDDISELPTGSERTRLENKLQDKVDSLFAGLLGTATTAVEKAEEFKDYQDYTDATTKVNLVPTGAERTALEDRLNAVQTRYDNAIAEATIAVELAEKYLTREDYINAQDLVINLPTCAQKNPLTTRLDTVEQRYQKDLNLAENAVIQAEKKEEMVDLDLAQSAIDVLPGGTDKEELQERLDNTINEVVEMHLKATEEVRKAEEYINRGDYISADDLVSKLPNGSEKEDLRDRLDTVDNKYQKDLQIAIETVEEAEEDACRDDYYYAVGKVEKLPIGTDRTELEERLNIVNERYIDTIREVEQAVVKAEEKLDREDYYDAITKVGTVIQGSDKTLFEERLAVVEADFLRDLALATEAVEKAEEYLTREDYDNALELVSKLPSGDDKTELEERLKEVNERYNEDLQAATEAVEKVEDIIDLEDYDNAKELVNKLPAGEDKTELEDRLNKVDEEYKDALNKATESVEKAEEGISREDYENARDEVNALPPGNDRDDLEERLDAVEDKYQIDLEEATEAVEKAEEYLDREDYDNAKDKVDNLPDGNEKEELKDRIEEVNDKYKDDLAKATEAVEKAESTLQQGDVDDAQNLVNQLPSGKDKEELQNRLDKLQKEVDDLLKEATEAVEEAEETLDRNDLEDAKDKVDKLPEGAIKKDLIDRLEKVEEEINRIEQEKENLIREATEAVEKAEETLKREDHTTAQGKVDLLETGQVKNDLQERLDKLLEAIKAKEESEAGSSGNSGYTTTTPVTKDIDKQELQKRIEALSEELLERLPFTIPVGGFSLEELLKLLDDAGISYEGIPVEALTEIALGVQTLELKIGSKVLSDEVEGVSVSDREEIVFKDIPVNHWAKDSIAKATRKGYLVGTEEGVYSPNVGLKFSDTYVAMNRVLIAHKKLSSVMSRSDAEKLTDDISKEHWAYFGFNSIVSKMDVDYAIELLPKDSNIINKVITREEIAKTIQAVMLGGEITNSNQTAIEYVNEIGVMVGDEKGEFNPDKELTRAELAAVIMRLDKIVSANK